MKQPSAKQIAQRNWAWDIGQARCIQGIAQQMLKNTTNLTVRLNAGALLRQAQELEQSLRDSNY